jgi:N-acetylneuraminic acid mutarotase
MFKLGTTVRRVALLAFALALGTAAVLAGTGTPFGSGATDTSASWRLLPRAPLALDAGQTSVWTGSELIVFGLTGAGTDGNLLDSTEAALAYDPAERTWRRLAAPPRTDTYCRRHAVWTGREMLVWGCSLLAYDPAADHWRRLPQSSSGAGIVVWTGRELLGWGGGCCGDATARGEAFDPDTETWRAVAESPLAPEQQPLGAWTGHELVLFVSGISAVDGNALPSELARAAAYDPATDTWRRIAPLPEPRVGATSVWNGRELLVVGGRDGNGSPARVGLAYNPATDGWRRLPAMETGRMQAVAVWTGDRLLVWGGELGREALLVSRTGYAFDPVADRWSPLPDAPIEGRFDPVFAWTGRELIVWGGRNPQPLADGATLDLPGR